MKNPGPQLYYFLDLVKKITYILEAIAAKDELSVADLVRLLNLNRNAVNHVVLTLTDLNYLTHLNNRCHTGTTKLFHMSSGPLNDLAMSRLVNRHVQALTAPPARPSASASAMTRTP